MPASLAAPTVIAALLLPNFGATVHQLGALVLYYAYILSYNAVVLYCVYIATL